MSRHSPQARHSPGPTQVFRAARDQLLNPDAAASFTWPRFTHFNWARDWFDAIAQDNDRVALWIAGPDGDAPFHFAALKARSDQAASWFLDIGVRPGERVMTLLPNGVALYEIFLGAIKLGLIVIPGDIAISADDFRDRVARGRITRVIADAATARGLPKPPGETLWISVGGAVSGWLDFAASHQAAIRPDASTPTRAGDPLFGYFTSGATSRPKLVLHTHASYPVGHLSSMYWNGVRPGDVHLNVSSPGWAKHAWGSLFVPWNAEATIVALADQPADPRFVLDVMRRRAVTTFCAPPTVWRMLIKNGLGDRPPCLREAAAAGEPLAPCVADAVREAWGVEVRDGYGQTETTAQIGNPPGRPTKPGSIGRALPGYDVVLLDPDTGVQGRSGEICLDLRRRPVGLMRGYDGDPARTAEAIGGRYYRTGDLAAMDDEGRITIVGRRDDVFKSFDVRISPYEIERALSRHPAIADVAVAPSPDPIGLAVPKAFIRLADGFSPTRETADAIDRWQTETLAPERRVRRLSFVRELPRTLSGKIRRAELRRREEARSVPLTPAPDECFFQPPGDAAPVPPPVANGARRADGPASTA